MSAQDASIKVERGIAAAPEAGFRLQVHVGRAVVIADGPGRAHGALGVLGAGGDGPGPLAHRQVGLLEGAADRAVGVHQLEVGLGGVEPGAAAGELGCGQVRGGGQVR